MLDLGSAVGYLLLDTKGFESGFKRASAGMKTFFDSNAKTIDKLSGLSSTMTTVGTAMSTTLTLPILGAGAAAVKMGNDFEAQMSRVQAISGATGEELKKLNDLALQLGADTAFSASEAAEGMENLASAGFSVNEITQAMPGLLDLAASSGADLATSTEIAASAIRGFGLEASESGHVADVFAKAAADTNAQVEDMGEAMKYIAPVANAMGLSIEETAAAIGIMSDAGIKGGQAGTALRGALSRIASPSKEAAEMMDQLGLSFYDTEGNMLSLEGIVGELEQGLSGLTQEQQNNALITIFGQESLSGMLTLMQRGTGDLNSLTTSFEDADGAAKDMADTMLDNTKGSLEQLSGSLETAGIKIQQILEPAIRNVIDSITGLVNKFNEMDEGQQRTILMIAGIVAAIGPVMLIIGKVIGLIVRIGSAVSTASGLLAGLGLSFSSLIAPIGLVIAAVTALVAAWTTNFGGIRDATASIFASIQSIISSVLSIIVGLWQSNFANIQGIFTAVFSTLESVVNYFFTMIQDVFNIFAAAFSGDWSAVWEGVKTLFVDWASGIINILLNLLNLIIQTIVGIIGGVVDAVNTVFYSIANAFLNGWKAITDWFKEAVNDPVKAISDIGKALFDAGAAAFNSLWDGIKGVWEKITGWVEDAVSWLADKISFWDNESQKLDSKARTSGYHSAGLDYVPYNGYRAVLHEGEAVLTKEENENRNKNSGGDTFIFNSPEPIDEVTAAREFRKVKKEIAEDLLK